MEQELDSIQVRKFSAPARALSQLFKDCGPYKTGKGSASTNVVDRDSGGMFALPPDRLAELARRLESCRLAGVDAHVCERQGTPAAPLSGLMLDFDLALRPDKAPAEVDGRPQLGRRACQRLVTLVARALARDLVVPDEFALHVFFIVRPATTPLPAGAAPPMLKWGFHMLVPDCQLSRDYKKYLVRDLARDPQLHQILVNLGAVRAPGAGDAAGVETCLDQNSASVPVFFLGSCKSGGHVYPLEAAYCAHLSDGDADVERLGEAQLAPFNLVYEMMLGARPPAEMMYGADRALVTPRPLEVRATLACEVQAQGDRMANGMLGAPELEMTEQEVVEIARQDAEADAIWRALTILGTAYSEDYDKWRNVVLALANSCPVGRPDAYLPLARWFSQRSPDKWGTGGREALAELWAGARQLGRRGAGQAAWRPLTKRSIYFWASRADPARWRAVSRSGYRDMLARFVYEYGGTLEHAMVAKVVHAMLHSRFVVGTEDAGLKTQYVWFEFVFAGQPMQAGQIWKWRREADPDAMQLYISSELVDVLREIEAEVKDKLQSADTPEKGKYYKGIISKLATSLCKLHNDNFKQKTICQARYLFHQRNFMHRLDKDADVMGVGNGVLLLAGAGRPHSRLVSSFHEWPVSRYTEVPFRPFDAKDHWAQLLLGAFAKIFPEPDLRVWVMMYLSTALFHGLKAPLLLMLVGSGQNAKTWVARMMERALGDYATKLRLALLTDSRQRASDTNSALMRTKGRGFGYFEESNARETLNSAALKEMVNPGSLSGAEKYKKEETFEVTATMCALTNFDFIIETRDHGTWRRLRYYQCKAKFCPQPDPNNPYEHEEDSRFINEYINDEDCLAAFIGILAHFWDRLQREYSGQIVLVPSPTLDRETERYRNSQDSLNRFISERIIVLAPTGTGGPVDGAAREAPGPLVGLSMVASRYSDWYQVNVEARRYVSQDLIGDIENSALSRFLTRGPSGARVLRGCRVCAPNEEPELGPGEKYLRAQTVEEEKRAPIAEPAEWWNWSYRAPATPEPAPAPAPEPASGPPDNMAAFAEDERQFGASALRRAELAQKDALRAAAADRAVDRVLAQVTQSHDSSNDALFDAFFA